MPDLPQRLALDLQRAQQELTQERERSRLLLAELDRLNAELDRLRHSVHRESNSRLLAEEALDETRDRLQLAVDAAGLALWDWQLPAPQMFMSARWGDMIGDIAVEGYWDTSGLLDRVHPDDRRRVETATRSLLDGQQQRAISQHRVRTADGWIWVECHGMVAEHDAKGRPLRLMGTVADISERKRVETEVQRARDIAEQASRAKSEFLANMSHEVRTPLNALMGLTRLLMDSPLNAEQRNWLELIDSASHSLLSMLNDVLDLSRIEAGKLSIESVRFNLHDALREVTALYGEQARAKPLDFALDIAPGLPLLMQGDPGRLRQVLGNLLSNALKFTPRGGRIRIQAERIRGGLEGAVPQLLVRVVDSGVGISPRQQATIFDAFTQADSSTARRFGGSGLGLAICSRLVKLMGGSLELESALGQGSTFSVRLPMVEMPATENAPMSAVQELTEVSDAGQRFAGLNVLVAEDHPVNELLLNQLLKRLGCTVRNARRGDEAVASWSSGGIDIVLMDVQMPGQNGLEAARRIREQELARGLKHTPIVAVTANAMTGDREACLAAGMDGYVPKPVSPQALIRSMDDALLRAAGQRPRTSGSVAPPETRSTAAVGALDVDKLLRRLDGDRETLKALAVAMRSDLSQRLRELQFALAAQDADRAIAHAHGLKGSLGSMTADRGARLAKGLELAARSRDWNLFERALPLLQTEATHIDASLAELVSGEPPRA